MSSIGSYAFYSCNSLGAVCIEDLAAWCEISFLNVSANPLYYAGNLYLNGELVTVLEIPDSVTSIGEYAFGYCTALESITIPNGVTSIGSYAFMGCTLLADITLPDGMTSIGAGAFAGCMALESITLPDSVTSIGEYAFGYCTALESITIPDGVTSIEQLTFAYCTALTDIEIGNGVTSIDTYAFYYCTALTDITVPDSVTSIGVAAFAGCSSIESMTLPFVGGSASATSASSSTLFGYIFGPESYDGGESTMQYSGTSMVYYYIPYSLTSVTITGGKILYGAFIYCTGLESVTIGDGVTSIGDYAFSGCTALESVIIGDGVTGIGSYAFYCCTALESVTIGSSVTSISGYAFYLDYSIKTVYYVGTEEEWDAISIYSYNTYLTDATIYYGDEWYFDENGDIVLAATA